MEMMRVEGGREKLRKERKDREGQEKLSVGELVVGGRRTKEGCQGEAECWVELPPFTSRSAEGSARIIEKEGEKLVSAYVKVGKGSPESKRKSCSKLLYSSTRRVGARLRR